MSISVTHREWRGTCQTMSGSGRTCFDTSRNVGSAAEAVPSCCLSSRQGSRGVRVDGWKRRRVGQFFPTLPKRNSPPPLPLPHVHRPGERRLTVTQPSLLPLSLPHMPSGVDHIQVWTHPRGWLHSFFRCSHTRSADIFLFQNDIPTSLFSPHFPSRAIDHNLSDFSFVLFRQSVTSLTSLTVRSLPEASVSLSLSLFISVSSRCTQFIGLHRKKVPMMVYIFNNIWKFNTRRICRLVCLDVIKQWNLLTLIL